jgi:nuclease-like protein
MFGPFAPLVSLLVGPKRSTEAWGKGAEGEELVGPFLAHSVGDEGIVLHDRRIPRSRANLDHIAIVASGIWVIDSKHYRGRLQVRTVGGWFVPHRALFVGRFEHSALVRSAARQRATVAKHVPPDVPVKAALCFTGVELGLFARPVVVDGVLVAWPKALAKALDEPGPLDADRRQELAAMVARAFPPYRA